MPVLEPQVQQQLQGNAQAAPEWARVLSQVLPMLFPTGASGAALANNPMQPAPQTGWGRIVSLLPLLLGAGGMAFGTLRGPGKEPSSLEQYKKAFLARGGVEPGEGKAIPSKATSAQAMMTDIAQKTTGGQPSPANPREMAFDPSTTVGRQASVNALVDQLPVNYGGWRQLHDLDLMPHEFDYARQRWMYRRGSQDKLPLWPGE